MSANAANFGKVSIEDLARAGAIRGKRVLMRVDFNVPLNLERKVKNDLRIRGALPTLNKVLDEGGSLILMSHLGRPSGKGYEEKYSLKPVAERLEQLLKRPVQFVPDCLQADKEAAALRPGDVLLLENLRFYKAESSKKEPERMEMAKKLASYGDIFISDAFGTAHRDAASMTGIPKVLGFGACGYLMQKEIEYFAKAMENPAKPFCAIVGGAKVSDKILLLEKLMDLVDVLLIGGAMAYTFLKAQSITVGKSKCETVSKTKKGEVDIVKLAGNLISKAKEKRVKLLLPIDHRCAPEFKDVTATVTDGVEIPADMMALDIGPKTEAMFAEEIRRCRTTVWNGPMGVFEMKNFRSGTFMVARMMAETKGQTSIVAGGDSASAAEKSGYAKSVSHVSTGGGASLELLEGKILPGLAALTKRGQGKL